MFAAVLGATLLIDCGIRLAANNLSGASLSGVIGFALIIILSVND
jgi:hypothetical protein